ncbi:MAG: hypothetical protein PHV53_08380 [Fermentimonas sp.]|nr:hypothetical protein [Fermentimonas sp.]
MQSVRFLLSSLLLLILCYSCSDRAEDIDVNLTLSSWDRMIDSKPRLVSDSLKTLEAENLNRSNRAYYNLLKVITDDKTYVNFTSDSLINSVTYYYRNHDPKNPNLIRSLAYQGIVRTRIGVRDSTVYEPLREADKLLSAQENPNPSLGYLIHYFLGNINYIGKNYSSADDHYQRSHEFAHLEKDSVHLFDTFLALFWNEIQQKNLEKGKNYLDSLSAFYSLLPGKDYFILNAQSFYFDVVGDPVRALEKEKAKLSLVGLQDENIDISRVYFNVSKKYLGFGILDSAMLYAQIAIDMIEDSTFRQNYLYYQNVADIAEMQDNFTLANKYRKNAFEMYVNSAQDRFNTQIAEFEKRYDLTEAENEALLARQQSFRVIIGALILTIVMIIILMYARKVRRLTQLKLMQAEEKMRHQEIQAEIMRKEEGKRKWLLQLYGNISDRLTFLQGEFEKLTQRYVSTQPKVYKDMQTILKNTDSDLRDINKTLTPDDETFYSYTHLNDEKEILNANEKLMLMLLACDANNRQLATFMNTTVESIRVRKSQLKKKMSENKLDISLFND